MRSGFHAVRLCTSSCPDSTLRLAPASAAAASGATAKASGAGDGAQKSGHSRRPAWRYGAWSNKSDDAGASAL